MRFYVLAYCLGMAWFAGFLTWAVWQPENHNAGGAVFFTLFGIAIAPCAVLATYQRIRTGRWIN